MKKAKLTFTNLIKKHKGIILDALEFLIVKLLKLQLSGGIKGWLIKTLIKNFSKEVYEFIQVNVENVEIKIVAESTVDMEDRNEATDVLNDIIR